jgi:hypothetical protein
MIYLGGLLGLGSLDLMVSACRRDDDVTTA